jgi:ketosteroid isomerase-like protein
MEDSKLLQRAFAAAFGGPTLDEAQLDRYFSADYRQHVDGQTLDRAAFLAHLRTLRSLVQQIEFSFELCFGCDGWLFSRHLASETLTDGRQSVHRVHALFRIVDGQIAGCDEWTEQIGGDPADRDLGSRRQI